MQLIKTTCPIKDDTGKYVSYPNVILHYQYKGFYREEDLVNHDVRFNATLQYVGYVTGRATTVRYFKDIFTGVIYPINGTQFEKVLFHAEWVTHRTIEGLFQFVKRGDYVSLALITAKDLLIEQGERKAA